MSSFGFWFMMIFLTAPYAISCMFKGVSEGDKEGVFKKAAKEGIIRGIGKLFK